MRHLFLIGFVFCLFVVHAQPSSEVEEIKKADEQLNNLIRNNRANEAAAFYADEFILTTSSGKANLKLDMLHEIAIPELKLEINKTENVKVRVVGATAVRTGTLHQKGLFNRKAFDAVMLVTDTWIKIEADWKLLAGHASVNIKS